MYCTWYIASQRVHIMQKIDELSRLDFSIPDPKWRDRNLNMLISVTFSTSIRVISAPLPVRKYPVITESWKLLSPDILLSFTTTHRGNRNQLVMIDVFTCYCRLAPVIDETTKLLLVSLNTSPLIDSVPHGRSHR